MRTQIDCIPSDLKERPQWVGFRVEGNNKTPFIADDPTRKASSTDSKTWRPFSQVVDAVNRGTFNALAYALDGDFIGIDLDHCIKSGQLTSDASEVVRQCQSYTERSISGDGIHILLRGQLPEGKGKRVPGIELYNSKRFFIITGDHVPDTPLEIRSEPDAVMRILNKDVAETIEAISIVSIVSDFSAFSATCSVEDVILKTIPKREGERNLAIFNLARGLHFNCNMAGKPLRECKEIVRQWYEKALPVIRTKDFTETWSDFIHAWRHVRLPLGAKVLPEAWKQAQTSPPAIAVEVASEYDSETVRLLIYLCVVLASWSSDGRFFLSSHKAAKLLKVQPMQVSRWFNMLIADKHLEILRKGNQRQSTRYRWTAFLNKGKQHEASIH